MSMFLSHRLWSCLLVGCLAIAVLGVNRAGSARADTTTYSPYAVVVTAPALAALVAWHPPADPTADGGLVGYEVEVRDHDTNALNATQEVAADASQVAVTDLPRWADQVARVTAVWADGLRTTSDASEPFQVLSTVRMVDDTPIVVHGDGVAYQTYCNWHQIELDAPMPVDVWLLPTAVEFDGSGDDGRPGGLDQTDPTFPGGAWPYPIEIQAGETTGRFQICHWGDDVKRFVYAHQVIGFEATTNPRTGGGTVHMDQARQDFTIYEDDPYFWGEAPQVNVAPKTVVAAGRTARVRVRLAHPVKRATVLTYRFKDETAHTGRDYAGLGGKITVHQGQRIVWVRVPTRLRAGAARNIRFVVRVTGASEHLARLVGQDASVVHIEYDAHHHH